MTNFPNFWHTFLVPPISLSPDIPLVLQSQIFPKPISFFFHKPGLFRCVLISGLSLIPSCLHIWGQHCLFYLIVLLTIATLSPSTLPLLDFWFLLCLSNCVSLTLNLSFSQLILHTLIRLIFLKPRSGLSNACLKPIFDIALPTDPSLSAGIQDQNVDFIWGKSYWGKKAVLLVSEDRSRTRILLTAGYLLSSLSLCNSLDDTGTSFLLGHVRHLSPSS